MKGRMLTTMAATLLLSAFAYAAPGQALASLGEDHISHEVRHELLMLPYYGVFDYLAYSVDGHVVTLTGEVTRPTLKSEAENVVKRIEGVEKVDNRIEVLPVSPNDNRIRLATFRSIYFYPALERYAITSIAPIRIIVKNGNVDLKGVVGSKTDKNLVSILANGVPGVFSVKNDLGVEKPA